MSVLGTGLLAALALALIAAPIIWFGKDTSPMATTAVTAADSDGISIKPTPGDPPQFERVYKARINADVTMSIRIKTSLGHTMRFGELDQTGGRWVLFEPERPADKILDRELLPVIQDLCKRIIATDDAFRRAKPGRFTDSHGDVWVRQ